ncbi:carbohydrate-binding domain-containing protein [Candidatus Saccharibacteria bacterium]|nr:carbohydrate-binding domain-containing protein [Candidatus Saccharibacteria bacterium]
MKERNSNTAQWLVLMVVLISVLTTAIIVNNSAPSADPANSAVSAMDIDNGDLKINWDRYNTYEINLSETENVSITNSGTYHLTGSSNTPVIVNAGDGVVKLILDNVAISNETGPAIACYAADDLVIELVGENRLEDGSTYDDKYDEDINGAIYSKADLTFLGDGKLTVVANYQDGIVSKDDLVIRNGTYNITAADDGIRGKDSVYVVGGDISVTSKEDAIKSTNDTTPGKGFVLIENGNIAIAAGDDGIHAESVLTIQNGTIDITKSYEGLEAPKIVINGGDVAVKANDDGINAGSSSDNTSTATTNNRMMMDSDANCEIIINDGNLYVNAAGDGIDSNGYIYFNGGTVIVDGPTNNGNGALDAGIGITANGGTVIAVGASGMAESLGSTSAVNNISVYFTSSQKAGTKITIKNSADETVLSHTSAKAFNHLSAATEKFVTGETYTIYLNGTEYETFTVLETTTTVGNTNSNTPGGGNMMRPDQR